jgi:hypothetical protein
MIHAALVTYFFFSSKPFMYSYICLLPVSVLQCFFQAMKINRNQHQPTSNRRQGRDSYSEETIDEESGYGYGHGRGNAFKSEGDDEADMELRYRALYEQKMNPFAEVIIYPRVSHITLLCHRVSHTTLLCPGPYSYCLFFSHFRMISKTPLNPHFILTNSLPYKLLLMRSSNNIVGNAIFPCVLLQQFSQLEKQRRVQELSVADRIVLNTTVAFVSTHTGRRYGLPLAKNRSKLLA